VTDPHHRRRVISSAAGIGIGGLAYFLTLFNLSRNLDRTGLASGFYSGVYELQARAFLDGRIALERGSMGIEGFIRDGQEFMYFPPFPALLRLPILMTTMEYDGRLTLLSMALAWLVLAVMVTKTVWLLLERLTGTSEVSRTAAVLVGVFLAGATGGTFMTYDAGVPWVYHEVYTWAIAASTGALYWLIRVLLRPDWHAARWLGAFCLATIGTRMTGGLAICVTVLVVAVWMRLRPSSARHRRMWWGVALAATVPLILAVALNVYKFDHPYMFPLEDQVWTELNERRREALAANGGTITGLQFFTTSFMAYLNPTGIRFVEHFPWVTLPAEPATAYHGAFVDQAYRTGSVTAFMPWFMLLTVVSTIVVFSPWGPRRARVLRVPMVASVLITGGVMAYGYYSARYASEFVPALVLGGAVGTCLVVLALRGRRRWSVPVMLVAAALTAFSILAQTSIGMTAAAFHARGEPLERFLRWQNTVTPQAQAALVREVEELPDDGSADELAIVGDCDALFVATGDAYEPWITVQDRAAALRIHPDGPLEPGIVPLYRVRGSEETIGLQVGRGDRMRVVLSGLDGDVHGHWFEFPPTGYVTVGVRNLTEFSNYEISSRPGGLAGYLRSTHTDLETGTTAPTSLERAVPQDERPSELGLRLESVTGLDQPLCEQIRATASDVAHE
jgi:hypothetical protein